MRTLAVNTFVSLDGVVQAPGGLDEDPTGSFTLGGWAISYFDDEMIGRMAESDPYELLLGRGTYENLRRERTLEIEFLEPGAEAYVFTFG